MLRSSTGGACTLRIVAGPPRLLQYLFQAGALELEKGGISLVAFDILVIAVEPISLALTPLVSSGELRRLNERIEMRMSLRAFFQRDALVGAQAVKPDDLRLQRLGGAGPPLTRPRATE